MVKKRMNVNADERKLLAPVDRGEWKSGGGKRERAHYPRHREVDVPEGSAVEHSAV